MRATVLGAGGFIGGHLTRRLIEEGHAVTAVDTKPLKHWEQRAGRAREVVSSLRDGVERGELLHGRDEVYDLAADMGGMGYIATHRLATMLSVRIALDVLESASLLSVGRLFYASSACVYPNHRQAKADAPALKEEDAYPADPEDGYGWEKLFSERLCRHYAEETELETRVGRYHNVFGPMGTWEGGREKAPAAICRKVARAVIAGRREIEIWGDGEQTRSFMYVADCVEGTIRLMRSDHAEPLNLGSAELVTINQLVDLVEDIAGVKLKRVYVNGPQGVRGRCSDNTRCREVLGWEPSISLRAGLEQTYPWIYDRVHESYGA